jgi:hypothetical protein
MLFLSSTMSKPRTTSDCEGICARHVFQSFSFLVLLIVLTARGGRLTKEKDEDKEKEYRQRSRLEKLDDTPPVPYAQRLRTFLG